MLSSREGTGVRSARKYAVHGSSPLARDSTNMVYPLRTKRKDSFSTSHHMHGLGGEAKEAMLRSGLRVKRTNSLRVEATKGNATLTAALHHNLPIPELDIYRKKYVKKECEFAESVPSALCPFQFVPNDSEDMVARWQQQRSKSSENLANQVVPAEADAKIDDWLKDMRLKVHSRLVQKQQFTNTANPIETDPLKSPAQSPKKPLSPKSPDSHRKKEKPKMDLALDAIAPPLLSSPPSPSSPSSSSPPHSPHSPNSLSSSRSSARSRLSPKTSNRVAPSSFPHSSSSPVPDNKKAKKEKHNTLPPLGRNLDDNNPNFNNNNGKPRLPKLASHDSTSSMLSAGPLFHPRNEPNLKARRTYSEIDVRRVRSKARNSVGLDPITSFET